MATVSAPFLQPSAQEDTMEISSPGNRHLDDIEIDFDEEYTTTAAQDEHMGDGEEHTIAEYDEDMLQVDDDTRNHDTQFAAQQLPTIPDEDLIDYSDDEEEPVVQRASPQAAEPVTIGEDADDSAAATVDEVTLENTIHGSASRDDETSVPEHAAEESDVAEATNEAQPVVEAPDQDDDPAFNTTATSPEEASNPPEGALKPRVSTTSLFTPNDVPGTPTDTGLHPVTLYYAEEAYPLFRARGSADGLLKDDNLVSVSLADMIKACRQALIMRTKQEIDASLELIFTFDNLALSVVEDEPAAFQTSLQEVLDVYLQLQLNDGLEAHEVPHLDISCSLRVKFNNSIAVLRNAADRGEGLSSILPSQEEQYAEDGYQDVDDDSDDAEQAHGQYDEQVQENGQYDEEVEGDGQAIEVVEEHIEAAAEELPADWQEDNAHAAEHDEEEAHPHADTMSEPGSVTVPALSEGDSSQVSHGPDDEDDGTTHEHNLASEAQDDIAAGVSIVGELDPTEDADGDELYDGYEDELVNAEDPDRPLEPHDQTEEYDDELVNTEHTDLVPGSHDETEGYDNESNAGLQDSTDQTELNVTAGDDQAVEIGQVDGTAAAAHASHDTANEFELDLGDYEAPLTTSPASKRRRDADDQNDESSSSKKLRPS